MAGYIAMKLKLPAALNKKLGRKGGSSNAGGSRDGDPDRFREIPSSDEESGGDMGMTKHASQKGEGDLAILIECCSAWNLSSKIDAYVNVKLGDKKVHKTKSLWSTRSPIWTIKHDNVFILYTTEDELSRAGGLRFILKDFNIAGSNTALGSVLVSKKDIDEAISEKYSSERREFDVNTSEAKNSQSTMSRASHLFKGKHNHVSLLNVECVSSIYFPLFSVPCWYGRAHGRQFLPHVLLTRPLFLCKRNIERLYISSEVPPSNGTG